MASTITDYKDLDVWQVAMDLAIEVYKLAARLPRDERYGLSSQLRKAAVSVPSNIAEGNGRSSTGEYLQFLGFSNGSLKEIETQAILTERLQLLPPGSNATVLALCVRTAMMLTALKRSLTR
jgi:four helix bundle protein